MVIEVDNPNIYIVNGFVKVLKQFTLAKEEKHKLL